MRIGNNFINIIISIITLSLLYANIGCVKLRVWLGSPRRSFRFLCKYEDFDQYLDFEGEIDS